MGPYIQRVQLRKTRLAETVERKGVCETEVGGIFRDTVDFRGGGGMGIGQGGEKKETVFAEQCVFFFLLNYFFCFFFIYIFCVFA